MHKNCKFISLKFSNIKIIRNLTIYFLLLTMPLCMVGMESRLILRGSSGQEHKMPWDSSALCQQVLTIPQDSSKDVFYSIYKKALKALMSDTLINAVAEDNKDPFHGVVTLSEAFSVTKKHRGLALWCGVTDASALKLTPIKNHLENYMRNTESVFETMQCNNNHSRLQDYVTIRKNIMYFFYCM